MGLETAGALGAWVTGGFLAAGSVGAAVVGGAIIGAAIGGLVAAVAGGSIGKGMLFGAIGGAVMSGIGAGMAGGGMTTAPESAALSSNAGGMSGGALESGAVSQRTMQASVNAAGTTGKSLAEVGSNLSKAASLEEMGSQLGVNVLTEGVKGYVQSQAQNEAMENAAKQAELQRQHEKDLLQMRIEGEAAAGGGGASGGDTLAYNARMAELNQRKTEFDRTMGLQEEQWGETKQATANRRALFSDMGNRGVESEDTTGTTGIFDELQDKPTSALVVPKEEEVLA